MRPGLNRSGAHHGKIEDAMSGRSGWEGKGSDTRWRNFRAGILRRDRYLCQIRGKNCTDKAPLIGGHVDHITPLARGGQKYDPENVRAACATCNQGRRIDIIEEPAPKRVSNWGGVDNG